MRKKDTFKVRMLIKSKKINKNIIKFVRINNNLYFCALLMEHDLYIGECLKADW